MTLVDRLLLLFYLFVQLYRLYRSCGVIQKYRKLINLKMLYEGSYLTNRVELSLSKVKN
jgi:hypothetical protein